MPARWANKIHHAQPSAFYVARLCLHALTELVLQFAFSVAALAANVVHGDTALNSTTHTQGFAAQLAVSGCLSSHAFTRA